MILESIVVHNFGVYRGRQEISFWGKAGRKKKNRPVTLLGAMNGAGKTTLLDAVQLALFGKAAHQSNRGNLGYLDYLQSTINRYADPHDGAAIELGIRSRTGNEEEHLSIRRFWCLQGNNIKESLLVIRNGTLDQFASENWPQMVEEICPKGVAHLFFFDGEKIEKLANPILAGEAIQSGFYALLGLDIVDRLAADLSLVEKRILKQRKPPDQKMAIEQLEKEHTDLVGRADILCQELGEKINALEGLRKEKQFLREKFEKLGGKMLEQHDRIEEKRAELDQNIKRHHLTLRHLSSDIAPLCLLESFIKKVYRQAKIEADHRNSVLLLEAISKRDADTLQQTVKSGFSYSQVKVLEKILCEDQDKRKTEQEEIDIYLGEADGNIFSCQLDDTRKARQEILRLCAEIDIASKHMLSTERALAAKPDNDSIKTVLENIEKINEKLIRLESEIALLERQYAGEQAKIQSKSVEIKTAYEKGLEAKIMKETNSRIVKHSQRVRQTMEVFKNELSKKHLRALEHFICESFQQLLHKQNFISRVEIAAETFALSLFDERGKQFDTEKLSAGERQLLAIAIVWGLAKAAGRPLPTIIDTPLGRLDSEHRDNVVKHYFPNASHQVILLSTDTEIDQKYYQMLKSSIGLEYRISFDKSKETSEFTPGYFSE